jgi:hypothetical protein
MCSGKGVPGNSTTSSGKSGRRLTLSSNIVPASAGEIPRLYAHPRLDIIGNPDFGGGFLSVISDFFAFSAVKSF